MLKLDLIANVFIAILSKALNLNPMLHTAQYLIIFAMRLMLKILFMFV